MLSRDFTNTAFKSIICALLTLACFPLCSAQQSDEVDITEVPISFQIGVGDRVEEFFRTAQPRLFGEYGPVGECDETARLDNFAIELQNNPQHRGFIIFYQAKDALRARLSESWHLRALDYMVNLRGIDATRVEAISGGFREAHTTELWILPEGAPKPKPTKTVTVTRLKGLTYKYDERYVELPLDETDFVEEQESDEIEGETANATLAEDKLDGDAEREEKSVELPIEAAQQERENAEEIAAEEDYLIFWASENYVSAVREEVGAVACIYYFADIELPELAKLQAVVDRGKNRLIEKYGLKAESIVTLYGGYRTSPHVELWVVPAQGRWPIPIFEERPPDEPVEETQAP